MGINEGIDSYYTRFNALLKRWTNHGLTDQVLACTFVGGVWPDELRIYLKEQNPQDIATAYTQAKTWEEARVNTDFAQYAEVYPPRREGYDHVQGMDAYGRDHYPFLPPARSQLPVSTYSSNPTVRNPQPLAIKAPTDDILMNNITKLEKN